LKNLLMSAFCPSGATSGSWAQRRNQRMLAIIIIFDHDPLD
jgi:hypothetical protein